MANLGITLQQVAVKAITNSFINPLCFCIFGDEEDHFRTLVKGRLGSERAEEGGDATTAKGRQCCNPCKFGDATANRVKHTSACGLALHACGKGKTTME